VVQNDIAIGGGEHQGAQTEESAGRNLKFHVNPATGASLGVHRAEFATTTEDEGHYIALEGFGAIDSQNLDGLALCFSTEVLHSTHGSAASQWICRAPARNVGKSKSYQLTP
jgi:hypothetical protein